MKIVLLIILVALLAWKGYHAWRRGRKTYVRERQEYQSLWEYLMGNGTTGQEVRRMLLKRAFKRAVMPWLMQWRYWLLMAVLLALLLL